MSLDKIKQLEEQIEEIKKGYTKKCQDKYNYLIGKCLYIGDSLYEKIINIDKVDVVDGREDEISYDCITIEYNNICENYDRAIINLDSWNCGIPVSTVESFIISEDEFNNIFEECVKTMRKNILTKSSQGIAFISSNKWDINSKVFQILLESGYTFLNDMVEHQSSKFPRDCFFSIEQFNQNFNKNKPQVWFICTNIQGIPNTYGITNFVDRHQQIVTDDLDTFISFITNKK